MHRWAHRLGLNRGRPIVTPTTDPDVFGVGFWCEGCGLVSDRHLVYWSEVT